MLFRLRDVTLVFGFADDQEACFLPLQFLVIVNDVTLIDSVLAVDCDG